jgi:DHA1 family bicyclomycin/chloramphenicol resistance-like MFS transporter
MAKDRPRAEPSELKIVAFGAGLFATLPLSTDLMLIALPRIAQDFHSALAGAQGVMAAFTLGFAAAHLVIGGLADHFGRRPVAIVGLTAFALCAVAAVWAPTLEVLIGLRFVQGCAGATGPILMRALVRDAVTGPRSARVLSWTGAASGVAPLLAPLVGAAATEIAGWPANFVILGTYAALLAVAVALLLPETLAPESRVSSLLGAPHKALLELAPNPAFRRGVLILAFGYGALFTWLSTAPFLLIGDLGMAPRAAALIFAAGPAGFIAGNLLSAKLSGKWSPARIVLTAATLALAGLIAAYGLVTTHRAQPVVLGAAMLPFYIGWGIIQPQAIAVAMMPFRHMAGQASSWLGAIQQLGGIVLGAVAVYFGGGRASLMVMVTCVVAIGAVALFSSRNHSGQPG